MRGNVSVVDVTLRDGFQNEPKPVSTRDKLRLAEKLIQAGIKEIQATSFVHPKWVPQMADAEAVAAGLNKFPGVRFSALVPNMKGYERAVAAGILHHEFVMSASDSFNRKNLNLSIAQSLELLDEVTPRAKQDGVEIRVGIATSFHCPFEGTISTKALLDVVKAVRERCQWKVGIADTDGMAFPDQVTDAVNGLHQELKLPLDEIALLFPDTFGRGLSNVLAGLKAGIREFDSTTTGRGRAASV